MAGGWLGGRGGGRGSSRQGGAGCIGAALAWLQKAEESLKLYLTNPPTLLYSSWTAPRRRAELALERTPAGRGSDASSPDSCGFNTPFHGNSLVVLADAAPEEMAGLAKALDHLWSLNSPEEGDAASVSPVSSPAAAAAAAASAAAKRTDIALHANSVWLARARAAERARCLGSAGPVEASPPTRTGL